MEKERVAIFIDGSNFHWSVQRAFHKDDHHLDFARLIFELTKCKEHVGTWYVNGLLDKEYNYETYMEQQSHTKNLEKVKDFHVRLCRMVKREKPGVYEYQIKGDDVDLSIQMVSMAYEDKYDTAILITGDDDFEPAVKKVISLGKKVVNGVFSHNQSEFLKAASSGIVSVEEIVGKCLR